jgi:ABC-type polysaccharide/polyol phosphate export permease
VFPSAMQSLIKLNPMVYIVNGYRDSFVYNIPFWEKPTETIVFWVLTLLTLYISSKVFNKLSPHFADVL